VLVNPIMTHLVSLMKIGRPIARAITRGLGFVGKERKMGLRGRRGFEEGNEFSCLKNS